MHLQQLFITVHLNYLLIIKNLNNYSYQCTSMTITQHVMNCWQNTCHHQTLTTCAIHTVLYTTEFSQIFHEMVANYFTALRHFKGTVPVFLFCESNTNLFIHTLPNYPLSEPSSNIAYFGAGVEFEIDMKIVKRSYRMLQLFV